MDGLFLLVKFVGQLPDDCPVGIRHGSGDFHDFHPHRRGLHGTHIFTRMKSIKKINLTDR